MPAKPVECRAHVVATRALAPETLEADLRMDEPAALAFEAGQWISVPLGTKTVRAYTIASTPLTPSLVTLCADVAPGGAGSTWFRGLTVGDDVRFKGPLGGFVFSRADPRRPLFVAEEIGIVPIRSMLAHLYATGFGRATTLVYWGRAPEWMPYRADFRSLARRYPSFSYHPVVERAPTSWTGERGALVDAVARLTPSIDGLVAYVCGGEATIHAVRDLLTGRGMDRKAVKWEKFW